MPTYADELRRLADLLDKDFESNKEEVLKELRKFYAAVSLTI